MEFDTKCREDLTYQPPPLLLLPNNHLKPEIEDDFCFEEYSSSSKGFLHDLHHLDHQFSFSGSSLNPDFAIQSVGLDPFDPFTNGSPPNFDDFYESKPFVEAGGGGSSGDTGGGGGGGYLSYPKKTAADGAATDRSCIPFNCQDVKPVSFVIPDEGSCITAENGYFKEVGVKKSGGARAVPPTRRQCKGRKKSNSLKGQWTSDEDRLLIHLVEKYGVRKWSHIAQMLKGRIGKQCRERWHNHLRPDIKKDTWSEEEDKILIQTHAEVGNKWAEIAKRLPGRTENSIKNHWNATKRRQYSRRKFRSKYPRPSSLLQNYIKSLNLDGKSDNPANSSSPAAAATAGTALKIFHPTNFSNIAPSTVQPETMEFFPGDRLVPKYYDHDLIGEVPDFDFNENLFEESSIDSILERMPCPPPLDDEDEDDEKGFDMEVMKLDHHRHHHHHQLASFMQCDVKKEVDLMEMITQGNF